MKPDDLSQNNDDDGSGSTYSLDNSERTAADGEEELQEGDRLATRSAPCMRTRSMVHSPVDPPACQRCRELDADSLFDVQCASCMDLIYAVETTAAQLFALLRQWLPQTQLAVQAIVRQMLKLGIHVDDRDGLTDMTLLHYACKSGTRGLGDVRSAASAVQLLLDNCADPYLRCRWTNMAAIHYAAYFDVAPVVDILLKSTKAVDVDSPCSEFDHGSPLHIAALNLSLDAARCLIEHSANPRARDMSGNVPIDLLPPVDSYDVDSAAGSLIQSFRDLLATARPPSTDIERVYQDEGCLEAVETWLGGAGLRLGDRVVVGGSKMGIIRYCGTTKFSEGLWAGVELEESVGKNDGGVGGVRYFRCPPRYGIFAPIGRVARPGILARRGLNASESMRTLKTGRISVDHITPRINTGLRISSQQDESIDATTAEVVGLELEERVVVAGKRLGTIKYIGQTHFAPGLWYGVVLDKPEGKNDGSVNETRYFQCPQNYGIFAPPARICKVSDASESLQRNLSADAASVVISASTPRRRLDRTKPASTSVAPVFNASFSSRTAFSSPLLTNKPPRLCVGTNVLYSGEIGVVRYIGGVDFAEGVWIGVELRAGRGKHDGVVQGKRYFACKPLHGVLVRPNRLTVKGIKASQLLDE